MSMDYRTICHHVSVLRFWTMRTLMPLTQRCCSIRTSGFKTVGSEKWKTICGLRF